MTQTLLKDMRAKAPLVHCITNYVAMNIAANVVLAAGASPAMVHAPEEMEAFTPLSGAVTVNIGTLSAQWLESMRVAVRVANAHGIPWVLDPVAHFISGFRKQAAQDLLGMRPAILRGNASEIMTLAGEAGAGKGADSGDAVADAEGAAKALAREYGCVVAVTGPEDFVTDGARMARVAGGSALMPQVTALGCSQTALMGAYAAVGPAFDAALSALAHFKVAGTQAAARAEGPGSFQVHFLDALASVEPSQLEAAIMEVALS
ncbi:hydroxyethylthiazole kinase [Shimia sp. FJ5]|uniref:hydroxyethylthiazole kinase n=1 Tax=Shimia sp. FJ5 TaxID=3079054 RepID=UPI002625678C|nr:hydroxyethylthiazole kinase [Shimia sp. FJ5]MDV4146271.1 hydroxyethylthiazole kinase [Shimia sp. FJ5]